MVARQDLELRLKARDLVTGKLTKMQRSLAGIERTGRRAFRSLTTAAAGFVAAVGAFRIARGATEFEEQLARVGTLGAQARASLGEFRQEVLRIGAETGTTFEELNQGLFNAVSAGVEAGEAIGFLEEANRLAIAGSSDLGVAVSGLTTVVQTYGRELGSTEEAARQLFATQVIGKTTLEEVASSIGNVAGQAAEAGVPFEEVSASIGLLTREGLRADRSTTALRAVLVSLLKPSEKLREVMDKAGLAQGKAALQGRTLGQVLSLIQDAARDSKTTLEALGVPQEALIGFYALGRDRGQEFASILRDQRVAVDELQPSFDLMSDTLSRNLAEIQRTGEALSIAFAGPILDDINGGLTTFSGDMEIATLRMEVLGLEALTLSARMEQMFAVILLGGENIARLPGLLKAAQNSLASTAADLGTRAAKALLRVRTEIRDAARNLLGGTQGTVAEDAQFEAAISSAFDRANDLVQKRTTELNRTFFDEVERSQNQFSERLVAADQRRLDVLGRIADAEARIAAVQERRAAVAAAAARGLSVFLEDTLALSEALRTSSSEGREGLSVFLEDTLALTEGLKKAQEEAQKLGAAFGGGKKRAQIGGAFESGGSGLVGSFDDFSQAIHGAIDRFNLLRETGELTADVLSYGFANAFTDFISGTESAADAFRKFASVVLQELAKILIQFVILNALKAAFSGLSSGPDPTAGNAFDPSITGGGSFTTLTPLAAGGIVRSPTAALVGEAGPEAVIPLNGGAVPVEFPRGGGGGDTFVLNISAVDGASVEALFRRPEAFRGVLAISRTIRQTQSDFRR